MVELTKDHWTEYILDLQDRICIALERADGEAKFTEDKWERPEGGGGRTRVISHGHVWEKGGVNTSVVHGPVTEQMRNALQIKGDSWFACGLSLVLHPENPMIPTVHCNYRMFELYDTTGKCIDRWFGGGTDLTPYYLFDEDAEHFHGIYKKVCDSFNPAFYTDFKLSCDQYFVNHHRNGERRGIGGIFYDYQRPDDIYDLMFWMAFGKACGDAFVSSYLPIVERRKNMAYTTENIYWRDIRRGRYVEFNLVHDRGTLFGLKTQGRTESILMSLPPTARFEYNYQPDPGGPEERLLQVCLHPKDWV